MSVSAFSKAWIAWTASVKLTTTGGVELSSLEAVWRALTEPYKAIVSYYRGLRAILGHGRETAINGIRTVRLPPLADQPPKQAVSTQLPSWNSR
jgi:hypothetical protein